MSKFWLTLWVKKENIKWVNITYSQFSNIIHPATLCHRCFYHHHHLTKIEACQVTQQWGGKAQVWTKVSWVQSSHAKHYTLQPFLLLRCFSVWAVSSECEARDIWCGATRAVSCNRYSGVLPQIPQPQFKKDVSPTQLKFFTQAGWCWISWML